MPGKRRTSRDVARETQEAMTEVLAIQKALGAALANEDHQEAERLMAELTVAERRRNRLVHRTMSSSGRAPSYNAELSIREHVIQATNFAARPAPVRLLSDLSSARFGQPLAPERLSSMRRDEERSWRSLPKGRSVYVVSGLTFDRFSPARGILALSSMPLDLRVIAPASPRVNLLHILLNVCSELGRSPEAPWRPALERVAWRLARTVPTALPGSSIRSALDTDRVIEATKAELDILEHDDSVEREAAAKRAANQLDEHALLFGASRLRAVADKAKADER